MIQAILTDIEGTTSSIHFVRDVLFPYADQAMGEFLASHGNEAEVKLHIEATRQLADESSATLNRVTAILREWIRDDKKVTPLKALQGMIWRAGYTNGAFKAHMYSDAATQLHTWHDSGLPLFVYSSGSIEAQKLFFAHTEVGDLTPLFSNYFDTTIGSKRDAISYKKIAEQINLPAENILFLSDIEAELDAAREAGMRTTWLVREGEPPKLSHHPIASSFNDISPTSIT